MQISNCRPQGSVTNRPYQNAVCRWMYSWETLAAVTLYWSTSTLKMISFFRWGLLSEEDVVMLAVLRSSANKACGRTVCGSAITERAVEPCAVAPSCSIALTVRWQTALCLYQTFLRLFTALFRTFFGIRSAIIRTLIHLNRIVTDANLHLFPTLYKYYMLDGGRSQVRNKAEITL